jgi:hypothetical protein
MASNYFHAALEALREAAVAQQATHAALVAAAESNQRAGQAMVRAIEHALQAHAEHEDLRDTVRRLEALVLELVERRGTLAVDCIVGSELSTRLLDITGSGHA